MVLLLPDAFTEAQVFAFDTETHLIQTGRIAPPFVCMSYAFRDTGGRQSGLLGSDPEGLHHSEQTLLNVLTDSRWVIAGHNLAFDLGVVCSQFPSLIPHVWAMLMAGRGYDTKIGEKLLNLSGHGSIRFIFPPNGRPQAVDYHLADLSMSYLGKNRWAQKDDPESVRLLYEQLTGTPVSQYLPDFSKYAIEDAEDTLEIAEKQIAEHTANAASNFRVMHSMGYRVAVDFAYFLVTMCGAQPNYEYIEWMHKEADRLASPEMLPLLVENKFITPAKPEMAYKNGAIDSQTGLPKMKKAQPEKFAKKAFQFALAETLMVGWNEPIPLTDKGQSEELFDAEELDPEIFKSTDPKEWAPYISLSFDNVIRYRDLSPLIGEYVRRAEVNEVRTKWCKRIEGQDRIHFSFDTVKETGRASCRTTDLYASWPIHQIPGGLGDIDVRQGIRPRDNHAFICSDVSGLELCSAAQQTKDLLGPRGFPLRLLELLQQGEDVHAYMGAQFAAHVSPEFSGAMNAAGVSADQYDLVYQVFKALKTSGDEDFEGIYKLYRKMAKPFNLGKPGGLGARTLWKTAISKPYHLDITLETCKKLLKIHEQVLPEIKEALNVFSNEFGDERNGQSYRKQEDEMVNESYWYTSPSGMVRRGCPYTSGTNGFFLQDPGASAFNLALIEIQRACTDPSQNSILFGSHVIVPMHDEILLEVPLKAEWSDEEKVAHLRLVAAEKQRIFQSKLEIVYPDLTGRTKAEPALCMFWSKEVEPTYDAAGELIFHTPRAAA